MTSSEVPPKGLFARAADVPVVIWLAALLSVVGSGGVILAIILLACMFAPYKRDMRWVIVIFAILKTCVALPALVQGVGLPFWTWIAHSPGSAMGTGVSLDLAPPETWQLELIAVLIWATIVACVFSPPAGVYFSKLRLSAMSKAPHETPGEPPNKEE